VELNQAVRVQRSGAPSKSAVKGEARSSVQVSGSTVRKSAKRERLAPLKLLPKSSTGRQSA
jgi:hypothetical protein